MKLRKFLTVGLSIIMTFSYFNVFAVNAAEVGNEIILEAEDLDMEVPSATNKNSNQSPEYCVYLSNSNAKVGDTLTFTTTVPEDMTNVQIATRYKAGSSRATVNVSVNSFDYGSINMNASSTAFVSTDYGAILSVNGGDTLTVSYKITVKGHVLIDKIKLRYSETMPAVLDGETLINEDFSDCPDNFGFPSNASVTDGVLTVAEDMANYTLTTKKFDEAVKSLSKVDVSFDWTSNLNRGQGSKAGLEFRDDNGNLVFAIASGGGGTQLRYSVTGNALTSDTSTSEALIPAPTSKSIDTRGKTYTVRFVADFTDSTVCFSITDKETGIIEVLELEKSISATNLSKMIAGNYYTVYSSSDKDDASQEIDNFVFIGKSIQQFALAVNYVDSGGNSIASKDFGNVFNESTVTIGSTEDYYLNGKTVKNSEADSSYTVSSQDATDGVITKTVTVEVVSPYAVIADNFVNNGQANDDGNKNKYIMIATGGDDNTGVNRAPTLDADGNSTYKNGTNFGSSRAGLVQFNIDNTLANKAVFLKMYVDYFQANNGTYGGEVRLAAYTIGNIPDIENTTLTFSDEAFAATSDAIFSIETLTSKASNTTIADYITFDVSDAVAKALANGDNTITFKVLTPRAGVFLADKDSAGIGGAFQGKAAYLAVTNAHTVSVTGAEKITKNASLAPSKTLVPEFGEIKITPDASVAAFLTNDNDVYVPSEGLLTLVPTEDMTLLGKRLGLSTLNGAQVRFGAGLDENGKVMPENGLRFIATVDRSDTLASLSDADMGMLIAPVDYFDDNSQLIEGKAFLDIPAVKFQDETTFTAAVTNLAVNNYNRPFRAAAYVKVTDAYNEEHTLISNSVDRSIYQVSVGLMKSGVTRLDNGEAESSSYTTENATLQNVLTAYINQVGIRLSLTQSNNVYPRREGESGAYSGDVFFTVTSIQNDNGSYTISVSPDESFKTKVKIDENLFSEYVRINNNNSVVQTCIDDISVDSDGTLTFTFTPPIS